MFMSIWWTAAGFIHLIGATCFFFSLCFCVCWWCFQILFWNSVAALKQFHGNPTLQKTTVILRISPTARTSPTLSKTPCFLIFRGKNIFLLFFEYKIMTDLETNSLHSGVYIAWLWQCLQWAMAISIPWPRLEGLNSQGPYKYWGIHLWLIVIVTHNFRMFQIMFLVVGLAMFTTVIPEAMVLVRSLSKCINARSVYLVKMTFAESDPDNVVEVLMWTVDKNLQQFCAIFQLSKLFLCCWSLLLPHLQWSDDHSCTNFGKFLIKHFQLNFCLNHLMLFVFLVVKIGTECSKLTLKSRWEQRESFPT